MIQKPDSHWIIQEYGRIPTRKEVKWHNISDGPLPSVLQEVSLPIITNEQCEEMFRSAGHYELIPKIFICAGYKMGKKDACDVSIL